jgi:integrase
MKLSDNTKRTDKERIAPLLKRFSGRRPNSFMEEDWKNYQIVRAKEVSNRTVNIELQKWCAILKDARCLTPLVGCKQLPENLWKPGVALTLEEEKKLFETARQKPEWQAAYYSALLAGNTTMRGCELKGLRLGTLDLFSRTVIVQRATTKTDASRRFIPLNDIAYWAATQALKRAVLLGASAPEHYVFPAYLYRKTKGAKSAAGAGFDPTQPQKT